MKLNEQKRPSKHAMDAAHLLVRDLIKPESITPDGVTAMACAVVLLEVEREDLLKALKELREWVHDLSGVRVTRAEQRAGLQIFKRVDSAILKSQGGK